MAKWMLKQSSANIGALSRQTGLSPLLCKILAVRGYTTAEEITDFLMAETPEPASPWLFQDMDKAVNIVEKYLEEKRKIAILGDYDVDGIASTVILFRTLRALGAQPLYYIPDRETEGYGLNNEAIKALKEKGAELLITCDNGISAHEQIAYGNELGIVTVILDHHDMVQEKDAAGHWRDSLPPAAAIVDPKRADCQYPSKNLCAAAVCYRFSQALYENQGQSWEALEEELLPFAAIATICDIMELVGENRALVKKALPVLGQTKNLGLQALLEETGITGNDIGTYHIGYILGPCINASGRLETAALAVELFLAQEKEEAAEIAAHLVKLNTLRKELTSDGLNTALAAIEKEGYDKDKVMVLHCPDIPESIAGIVAGRVKERYCRPTVLISGLSNGQEVVRGSCRSVEGYHITQALSQCQDILETFGGHPMAAGFSMQEAHIPLLRQRLNQGCTLEKADMEPVYRIDMVLPPQKALFSLAQELQVLEPWGNGNHAPYFACKHLPLLRIALIGKEKQVMKLHFGLSGRKNGLIFISFNGKNKLEADIVNQYGEDTWEALLAPRSPARSSQSPLMLDLIYLISINKFNQQEYLQLQTVDIRLSRS